MASQPRSKYVRVILGILSGEISPDGVDPFWIAKAAEVAEAVRCAE
jgi:hypothetical protein